MKFCQNPLILVTLFLLLKVVHIKKPNSFFKFHLKNIGIDIKLGLNFNLEYCYFIGYYFYDLINNY